MLSQTPSSNLATLVKTYSINRDRETERQRDRKTERQRDRETERQRDRETERKRDIEISLVSCGWGFGFQGFICPSIDEHSRYFSNKFFFSFYLGLP
jgi:hypothetical protein